MDALSKKIITELDKNARQAFSQIAKKARSSKAVIGYRMKNLEKEGIIQKYLAVVNTAKLGYLTFKVFFQLQNMTEAAEKGIFEFLVSHHRVLRVVKLEGNYDMSAIVLAKSIVEFDGLLRDIKNKIGVHLKSNDVELILYSHMAGLKFIDDETIYKKMEFQGEPLKKIKIDELDEKLLKELAEHARKPLVEIALKLKSSADVIKYRLKRLEKMDIITRYRAYLDISKLGLYHINLLVKLQNASEESEGKMIEYVLSHKPFMYITKTIGSWDFEINLYAKDIQEFNDTLANFKNKFSNNIKSYSTVFVTKELKLNYYPF